MLFIKLLFYFFNFVTNVLSAKIINRIPNKYFEEIQNTNKTLDEIINVSNRDDIDEDEDDSSVIIEVTLDEETQIQLRSYDVCSDYVRLKLQKLSDEGIITKDNYIIKENISFEVYVRSDGSESEDGEFDE